MPAVSEVGVENSDEFPVPWTDEEFGPYATRWIRGLLGALQMPLVDSARTSAGPVGQGSIAALREARRSRSREYHTHLPRRSPCTRPASPRIFR